ncbi:MAG: hypothetical protein QOJ06_1808 [Pseudonocardiales bacterium]|nr:hypothetical protein [Pseudonocardiales bacterium]
MTPTHRLVPRRHPATIDSRPSQGRHRTDNRDDIIAVLSDPTDRRFDLRLQIVTMLTR